MIAARSAAEPTVVRSPPALIRGRPVTAISARREAVLHRLLFHRRLRRLASFPRPRHRAAAAAAAADQCREEGISNTSESTRRRINKAKMMRAWIERLLDP